MFYGDHWGRIKWTEAGEETAAAREPTTGTGYHCWQRTCDGNSGASEPAVTPPAHAEACDSPLHARELQIRSMVSKECFRLLTNGAEYLDWRGMECFARWYSEDCFSEYVLCESYKRLCERNDCSFAQGLNLQAFQDIVDDDDQDTGSCYYCTYKELEKLLKMLQQQAQARIAIS